MRIYLAGPMDQIPDRGVQWRRAITPKLEELGYIVLDPTMTELERNRPTPLTADHMRRVVDADLAMVASADAIVVNLNGPACGTYFEIARAIDLGKLVIVRCDAIPPWLLGYPISFVDSWQSVYQILTRPILAELGAVCQSN